MRPALAVAAAVLLAGCSSLASFQQRAMSGTATHRVVGESDEFIVVSATGGETAESLARTYLGNPAKSWMIEDFMGGRSFARGQEVVIPKKPWNVSGIEAIGYQLVPVLVYHNIGKEARGRLVLGVDAFTEQMRYLKTNGFRVVSVAEFVEWLQLKRQLPKKTVVLTFDDGYRSFRDFAYPVLKELRFTATLFVYTDYVGAGRNALSWDDLKALAAEGFDVQAHSKSHGDLRRGPHEGDAQYARRMQAELIEAPRTLARSVGRPVSFLAYPYGRADDAVLAKVKDQGYQAAFTVRRESNAAFVDVLRIGRSQVYAEMTLEQFAKNLNAFHPENLR
ncbi:MAG TPA: polysaccharide deacetylase family protein [Methylomirabilota bacterium]|nr:polysaccharide deacetylase family protein [Methylomirabilota bacterium]